MNGIILNIGLTAAALCLFRMLAGDKFKEQINFLTACVFGLCVFAQVAGAVGTSGISFDKYNNLFSGGSSLQDGNGFQGGDTNGYVNFSRTAVVDVKKAVAAEMNTRVREILAEHNVTAEKIYVIVNISQWNGISISEVKLVPKGDFSAEILADLQKRLGGDITVTVTDK